MYVVTVVILQHLPNEGQCTWNECREIGTHLFLDENWFPKCMLRLLHKRITIQSSPLKDYQSWSHMELLLTIEYVTQRTMIIILVMYVRQSMSVSTEEQ